MTRLEEIVDSISKNRNADLAKKEAMFAELSEELTRLFNEHCEANDDDEEIETEQ